MRRRLLLAWICIIISLSLPAQRISIEALLHQLSNHQNKKDSVYVNMLNKLAYEYLTINPDSTIFLAGKSQYLATQLNYPQGLAWSLTYKSMGYYYKGQEGVARHLGYEALEKHQKIENHEGIAATYNILGLVFLGIDRYDSSIFTLNKAYELYTRLKDEKGISRSATNIGLAYFNKGIYQKAIEYYLKSLKLCEDQRDKKGIANNHNNIALVYIKLKNYPKAIENLEKSFKNAKEIDYVEGIANYYSNLGRINYEQNHIHACLENYQKALRYFTMWGNKNGIIDAFLSMSNAYESVNSLDSAVYYLNKVFSLAKETEDVSSEVLINLSMGRISAKKKNFEAAEKSYYMALALANKYKIADFVSDCYNNLSEMYYQMGDYSNAYRFHVMYANVKDSLINSVNIRTMEQMQAIYNNEKKDKEISLYKKDKALQQIEIKQHKNFQSFMVVSLVLVLLVSLLVFRLYKQNKKNNSKLEHINYELEKLSIVAKQTDNGILICGPNGDIEWINEGFTKLYGYALNEMYIHMGKTLQEVSNSPEIEKIINQSIQDKKSVNFETFFTTKYGENIWVQSTLTPIMDEHGVLRKLIVIDTDITLKKLAQEVILRHSEELKSKNKDIMDSIHYAKHIQNAILPSVDVLSNHFQDSFVLYKPKDIVSGDFYFITQRSNRVIIATADCTGHGVPGALMSMIGYSLLNQVINEKGVVMPSKILYYLHLNLLDFLKKNDNETQDGMDIALCSIDRESGLMEFAGANRSLIAFHPTASGKMQMEEVEGDKYPIGGSLFGKKRVFNNHSIQINKGDSFYIFTDGYADQFGGKYNKKMKTKQMKGEMQYMQHLSMSDQKIYLESFFESWRGSNEQVDDVLMIGFKVS